MIPVRASNPGVVDGEVLKQSIGTALASGQFNRVPIINGTTHDEARLMVAFSELQGTPVTEANYQAMIASELGVSAAVAAMVATQYPLSAYPSPAVALSAVGTDALFACPALKLDKLASKFVATFAYEFNDVDAPQRFLPPVSFPYGAAHASEIQYLFDLPIAPISGMLTAQQQKLAASIRRYWGLRSARPPVLGRPTAVAALRQPQPADALARTAAAASRQGLRRCAPLRVLGSRRIALQPLQTEAYRAVPAIQAAAAQAPPPRDRHPQGDRRIPIGERHEPGGSQEAHAGRGSPGPAFPAVRVREGVNG